MSNFRFGDDYRLSYYPQEASDGWWGVDWDKVESVEIECDVYVKERTCEVVVCGHNKELVQCMECGGAWNPDHDYLYEVNYCPNCGARVVKR